MSWSDKNRLRDRLAGFRQQIAFTLVITGVNAARAYEILAHRSRALPPETVSCRAMSCLLLPAVSVIAAARAVARRDRRLHVYMADMWLMLVTVSFAALAYPVIARTETAVYVGSYVSGTATGCSFSTLMLAYASLAREKDMPPSGNWTDAVRDIADRRRKNK